MVVTVSSLVATILSCTTLGVMMKYSKELMKVALIFNIGMSFMVGILGLMWGQMMMAIMGFLSFAVGICYAYFVWVRIPFAAANLNTGITAVKSNLASLQSPVPYS